MSQPKRTSLFQRHVDAGGRMVPFAGFEMPVQYSGIRDEHLCVRNAVGLFDVSHMGEFIFSGPDALSCLQALTVNDVSRLAVGQAQYSAMCYPTGGLVDDLIVYRQDDQYMMVVNAGNLDKDYAWVREQSKGRVKIENISDARGLVALQGRYAQKILQSLADINLGDIKFYWFAEADVAGIKTLISRTGYTGEDGFEIMADSAQMPALWDALLEAGASDNIQPCGLGARDTLRLEMKYCLYGNDIDSTTNPLEAGLGWITRLEKPDFIGASKLREVKETGVQRRLVGIELEDKNIARQGYPIFDGDEEVGSITSGSLSISLEKPIALGYVPVALAAAGTDLQVGIRKRKAQAKVVKTPFYKRDY